MIFEARYRVLFSTLLAGMPGVEEGLVQADSPFSGTKKFGMCFTDGDGRLASVGTILEIVDFAHVQDGRLFVTTKGRERFKILDVIKEKPVVLAEVELMNEDSDDSPQVKELAKEVADLLRNTIRFNQKMNNIRATEDQLEPEELAGLAPRELSFWVVSFFSDVKLLQQNLLEEESTLKRLLKEKEILSETVKYYSASLALKNAFNAGEAGASEGGQAPSGDSGADKDKAQ